MSKGTGIAWTDWTLNAVLGCRHASPGCLNCYAERLAATRLKHTKRYKGLAVITDHGRPQWTGEARLIPEAMAEPISTLKHHRIFWTAMGDPFYEGFSDDEVLAQYGAMILAPHHTFQALTKRSERASKLLRRVGDGTDNPIRRCIDALLRVLPSFTFPTAKQTRKIEDAVRALGHDVDNRALSWPPKNIWLGASIERQAEAEERLPHLLDTPAHLRFVSLEPHLEEVDLRPWLARSIPVTNPHDDSPDGARLNGMERIGDCWERYASISWVIDGGESGPKARPFNLAWARKIALQCEISHTAFFFKQLGSNPVQPIPGNSSATECVVIDGKHHDIESFPEDLRIQQFPE